MPGPTNIDLHRDLGRMEGRIAAMEDRFDRVEQILDRIDQRLVRIEGRENQLRGAWWVMGIAAGMIGFVASLLISHLWK